MQGTAAANYIADKWPNAKVAVIHKDDDVYSTGVYAKFRETSAERGVEIVSSTTFATGREHDFNVQLLAARSGGADIVFLPIYYTPASLILTQANAMGFAPTFFGIDGMDGILGMEGFNTGLAEGVILLTPFDADSPDSKVQNFVRMYQEAHGEVPNQFAAGAYDVVWALYEMLVATNASASMSASQINDLLVAHILGSFTFNGVTGSNMTWDETGQVNKGAYAVIIQGGRYVSFN
jgi:branched-chain amino acid transport system substrate-binding protein